MDYSKLQREKDGTSKVKVFSEIEGRKGMKKHNNFLTKQKLVNTKK